MWSALNSSIIHLAHIMLDSETPGLNLSFAHARTLCKYALWYVRCIIILLHFHHLDRFICAHFTAHTHLLVLRVTNFPCNKRYINTLCYI
jgi:hypothetical protein